LNPPLCIHHSHFTPYTDEALWTNGPKESIEFFDYPFDEFFSNHKLPVYLPRQPVLEYMMGRCTKNCPDFFKKYMKFNTCVVSVKYLDTSGKFEVVTKHVLTQEQDTTYYDKCIWSAGENGRPMMPNFLINLFRDGGFKGRMIHSSDTSDFANDVKDKRILLIGGSYSAEDLALMAIKVGVEKVYVSTRQSAKADEDGDVISWTSAWPYDKVKVLEEQIPVAVTENGNCIQFSKTEWVFPNKYVPSKGIETELRDIDTIIFCTGYLPNFEMLDELLREAVKKDPNLTLNVPKDWKMSPNKLTDILGEVEPGDVRWCNSFVSYPGVYRGMSIANPNMMFILSDVSSPLCGIDVSAWLLLRFITGTREIPSTEEMWKQNEADALLELDNPVVRYRMDHNYFKAYEEHWVAAPEIKQELMQKLYEEAYEEHDDTDDVIYYRFVARMMQEADYPVDFGSYDKLSEKAKTIIHYNELSYYHRHSLDGSEPWRTFRDYTDGEKFRSIFTGTPSVSLKQKWLDIDAADTSILE
jgi:thioredoxin reductase